MRDTIRRWWATRHHNHEFCRDFCHDLAKENYRLRGFLIADAWSHCPRMAGRSAGVGR